MSDQGQRTMTAYTYDLYDDHIDGSEWGWHPRPLRGSTEAEAVEDLEAILREVAEDLDPYAYEPGPQTIVGIVRPGGTIRSITVDIPEREAYDE